MFLFKEGSAESMRNGRAMVILYYKINVHVNKIDLTPPLDLYHQNTYHYLHNLHNSRHLQKLPSNLSPKRAIQTNTDILSLP